MPRFDVNFADPKRFFFPGETVVGNIVVMLDQSITCKKITLKFKGKSRVHWTTGTGDDKKSHWNTEEYFKDCVTLAAPLPPDSELTLLPGEFSYPFQFQLPNDLPPSVDPPIVSGYIRYYMKVKIDVDTWRLKSDVEEKIPFKVVSSPVDLSQTGNLLEPATATEEKYLCCLCCQSGPIRLCGKIQKQAYVLGDQIIFSFELDNKETDKPLRKIEARLIEKYTFISNTGWKRRDEHAKSSVQLSEGVPPRGEDSWNDVALNIPTNITPSFNNCKCMHLEYYFIVNVDIESAFDPQVMFPVTISSAPQMLQQGNMMPGMVYPPPPTAINSPMGPPPFAGPLISQGYPQTAVYPPPTVTQQPSSTTWIPEQPPPAYHVEEKK